MKHLINLSLVLSLAFLLTACGEKTKEETSKAVESTQKAAADIASASKEAFNDTIDAAKKAVTEAKEATTQTVEATKVAATKAVDDAKESVETATTAVVDTVMGSVGKKLYTKCVSCHGANGKTIALGKSAVLAGQNKDALLEKLQAYKAGTRNTNGMGMLMKGQVASMDEVMLNELSIYIATFK